MRLFSKIYGDGMPLIIIHGLFGMSDNWRTLGKRFSKDFNVHLIDVRNHGRSPHDEEFNYEVMCGDLLEYLESHNIERPILLGHSLGGKISMKFAFTYPERTAKLVVADISPRIYNTDFVQNLLQFLYNLSLEHFDNRDEIDNVLASTYKEKGMRQFLLKNLYRKENKEFAWRFNISVLLEKVSNIQEADFINGVCNVPTHFIRGGNSNYITIKDKPIINRHFSNVSMSTIDRSGHWLHVESPDEFYNDVISFLSKE